MINLYNISKTYNVENHEYVGIKNVTLTIQKGDFVAITGRTGSGKTTLMDIISMIDRPTFGKYVFENADISLMDEDAITKMRGKKVGHMYQKPNFIDGFTVYQNLETPFLYKNDSQSDVKGKITKVLEDLKISDKINAKINSLSRKNQQLLALARALLSSENLIIADEPTGDLNSFETEIVLEELQRLNAKGVTIVIVTDDIDIARHAKRVILLKDGIIEKDINLSNPLSARELTQKFTKGQG